MLPGETSKEVWETRQERERSQAQGQDFRPSPTGVSSSLILQGTQECELPQSWPESKRAAGFSYSCTGQSGAEGCPGSRGGELGRTS